MLISIDIRPLTGGFFDVLSWMLYASFVNEPEARSFTLVAGMMIAAYWDILIRSTHIFFIRHIATDLASETALDGKDVALVLISAQFFQTFYTSGRHLLSGICQGDEIQDLTKFGAELAHFEITI